MSRPRFGRTWFPVFSVPYLTLVAGVLTDWCLVPLWTLAAFLATSVWHFGLEDAGSGGRLEIPVRAGPPIAVLALAHPAATIFVLLDIWMSAIERSRERVRPSGFSYHQPFHL